MQSVYSASTSAPGVVSETQNSTIGISKQFVGILIIPGKVGPQIASTILSCEEFSSNIFVCCDDLDHRTAEIASRMGAITLQQPIKLGRDASLRILLEYVATLSSDLGIICVLDETCDPSEIAEFIEPIATGQYDIVARGPASNSTPLDYSAKLRACDFNVLSSIMEIDSWNNADLKIIAQAKLLNLRVKEVPTKQRNLTRVREISKLSAVDVILTAYNDELSIGQMVREFRSHPFVRDVVVVNNNSKDRTEQVALSQGALVWNEENQGYGCACIGGLRYALANTSADFIALTEGDGTFSASDLEKMLPYLSDVDMVVGSRTCKALVSPDSQLDMFYVWGNLFIAKLMQFRFFDLRHLGRARFTDVGCTYRIIRREALAKFVEDLEIGGHHFSPHMTMTALSHGISVVEVPITFKKRIGESKGAGGSHSLGLKVGLKMIWHVMLGR